MRVKQYKGQVFGAELTAKEKKALNLEINRQILEADTRYTNDIDAMVLYVLHQHLGFGQKRLREFWKAFKAEHDKLRDYYEMPDANAWLARQKLKEIGVDVEAWNAEEGEGATQ